MINENNVEKWEKGIYIYIVVSMIYMVGFAFSTLHWDKMNNLVLEENKQTKQTIVKLKNNINTLQLEVKDTKDSLLDITGKYSTSIEYKRLLIYKKSGIRVSRNLAERHLDLMMATADYYQIPYNIYFRLGSMESDRFSSIRSSSKGAMFYFQIMPGTYRNYRSKIYAGEHTVESNIRVSGLILTHLYKLYKGNWVKVVAAYNAGEGAVDKYNGVPDYKETKSYVKFIMSFQTQL